MTWPLRHLLHCRHRFEALSKEFGARSKVTGVCVLPILDVNMVK